MFPLVVWSMDGVIKVVIAAQISRADIQLTFKLASPYSQQCSHLKTIINTPIVTRLISYKAAAH